MKNVIKDTLILFVITVVAGLLLAMVNEVTKGPIEKQKADAKAEALKAVFEEAESFENLDITADDPEVNVTFDEAYKALDKDGNALGYVIIVSTKQGYGGTITFAMGVTNERHLNGISILASSETVGLGLEAETVLVPQFKDKDVESFTYTKTGSTSDSEIDAISSATITTRAFTNAVNAGLKYYDTELSKGVNNKEVDANE